MLGLPDVYWTGVNSSIAFILKAVICGCLLLTVFGGISNRHIRISTKYILTTWQGVHVQCYVVIMFSQSAFEIIILLIAEGSFPSCST